ncbi:MAG: hypothetical protein LUC93_00710 [Planctomycetaceae bacterium]|nr:hypothetical protein [Planctomycetaceae bacterium]
MSNVALYERIDSPVVMENIGKMGLAFAKSGILGITTEAQGQIMAMTCIVEGITPVEFSRRYHIVEGRLSMKADAMLARYQELGGKVIWLETTDKICRARWIYNGNDIEISFSIDDAHRACLCGPNGTMKENQKNPGNWQKYPDAMLRARCQTKAIRMLAPQVNAGIYSPEEIEGDDSMAVAPPPPRRGKRATSTAAPEPEPREVDAKVADEAPSPAQEKSPAGSADDVFAPTSDPVLTPPKATIDLADIEDAANAYLCSLGWLAEGKTWRDLGQTHVMRIAKGMAAFRLQVEAHKEKTNA